MAGAFTDRVGCRGQVGMDGRGRALDNVFIERLWRSAKYDQVYLHDYGSNARAALGRYFRFYNHERSHQALGYRTPAAVTRGRRLPDFHRGALRPLTRPSRL
jgi:transposase InsO family protein